MDNGRRDVAKHTELHQLDPAIIVDHVWMGAKAVILASVRIDSRAAIGAGSIVTKDLSRQVCGSGNPARVLRHLTELD
jgi:maltose O-acetyltransferase